MNNKTYYDEQFFLDKYNSNINNCKKRKHDHRIFEHNSNCKLIDLNTNAKRVIEVHDSNGINNKIKTREITDEINVHNTEACSTETYKQLVDVPTELNEYLIDIGKCAEKSTYCRPAIDYYSQAFVFKTMSRNARLQRLLKNIVVSRQKERAEDAWKQYINELKCKHGYNSRADDFRVPEGKADDYPDICDLYNTRFSWNQSRQCQNLLEDFYGSYERQQRCAQSENCRRTERSQFGNRHYCYPTSSHGRLILLDRERARDFSRGYSRTPQYRDFRGNTIVIDKDPYDSPINQCNREKYKIDKSTIVPEKTNKQQIYKTTSVQVSDHANIPYINGGDECVERDRKENILPKSSKIDKDTVNTAMDQNILGNIESKLDELINIINKLMIDMNTKFIHYGNNESASTACKLSSNDLNTSRSETFGFYKTESLMCGISSFSDVGTSKALKLNCNAGPTKLNKILSEEINKSNKIKKDIDDILNGKSRSISLPNSLEEPTKDVCTEIMDSLSKDTKNRVSKKNKRCFTIAVNTEPIGLLGLLKISKETIRQILSYMPRIDYNSYLSMVQFPQLSKIGESDYICNICGAAFCRPSQLSEHIQKHNLDNTRNCCVCRHALDSKRRSALFSCRYCHQPFIRAYCCELHQRSCAKNFGVRHAESNRGNLAMLT